MATTPARGVLVVEDDDDTRASLRLALEDAGYVVEEAPDGARALEHLRASQERLVVLLDLIMPGADGLEVLRIAAVEPAVGRHVYLLLTADGRPWTQELRDLLTRLQVPTVMKPFELDRLLELVAAAVVRLA